jgi:fumarate reductase subunit D
MTTAAESVQSARTGSTTRVRRETSYRRDALWLATFAHRISGVLLAVFLPLHFLALGLAIEGEAALDGFLKWSERPIAKLAETGLVFLLGIHFLGGVRVLVIENMAWRPGQKRIATVVTAIAIGLALFFFVRAIAR